ncbi:MAG: DUF2834 domain-containing protein [Pseudomonadales bacterium]
MQVIYLSLAILGAIVPYIFFSWHFSEAGFGPGDFIGGMFINGAAGGIGADLLISSLVFWIYLWQQRARNMLAYVVVNLFVGLSCALPAYLYMEARRTSTTEHREAIA